MLEHSGEFWAWLAAGAQVLIAGFSSAHVILHKRDVRAAIGWVGLIWLVPVFGSVLYGLFGINRIRRRASGLRSGRVVPTVAAGLPDPAASSQDLEARPCRHLAPVARLSEQITSRRLSGGNEVVPLVGGSAAYGEMIAAIHRAECTIGLCCYIFDADATGQQFVRALADAVRRGVAVRVLVDGVGVRYSYPPITRYLQQARVRVAEFLPTLFPLHLPYANLRNHRKILVIDGREAFTGGMNIREGHRLNRNHPSAIDDIHFRLCGPVVAQVFETFADDWRYCTGEKLDGIGWLPAQEPAGSVAARAIAAGPDESFERIRWLIQSVLAQAREQIRIVTPYFLPDSILASLLIMAALRGVSVEIIVPKKNNLKLIQWASHAKIGHLLARGCKVWETTGPFDHSKLMTVDGLWSMFGSANWDSRSLRLNFELNVECYDRDLAGALDALIDVKKVQANPLTTETLQSRSLLASLRDGAAWLLSPYL